ncbi:hypothetical protein FIBSPDRAFT_521545 [Athelia psychrophila]|uniref:Secreted protein n=1 Tax=Athelia psychrophila TaxID=1759441 RepID=A0A166JUR8_9AGAM|nr:hypothetical protein FIBSPDRAFT_521545 [Fibularhizoctonia sp. CBS 109695]
MYAATTWLAMSQPRVLAAPLLLRAPLTPTHRDPVTPAPTTQDRHTPTPQDRRTLTPRAATAYLWSPARTRRPRRVRSVPKPQARLHPRALDIPTPTPTHQVRVQDRGPTLRAHHIPTPRAVTAGLPPLV